mgnify:CR=1 FL=1
MKIDISKIPNFDALPQEAKDAITGMDFADPVDMAKYVEKSVFDRKASEAADLAKQLKAKMTDDEAKAAEREANEKKIMEELENLRKEKMIADYKSRFLGLGYEEKLAADTAAALSEGKMDVVFANQQKHNESLKAAATAAALAGGKEPPAGKEAGVTLKDLQNMSVSERYEFSQKNPEQYKKLYGGN